MPKFPKQAIYPPCQKLRVRKLQGCILGTPNSYSELFLFPLRLVLLPGGAPGRRAAGPLLRDVPAGRRHLRRQGPGESGLHNEFGGTVTRGGS